MNSISYNTKQEHVKPSFLVKRISTNNAKTKLFLGKIPQESLDVKLNWYMIFNRHAKQGLALPKSSLVQLE